MAKSKFENFLKYIVLVIFGVIVLGLFMMSTGATSVMDGEENIYATGDSKLKHIVILLVVLGIGTFVKSKHFRFLQLKNAKKFLGVMTLLNVGLLAGWIGLTQFAPTLDQNSIMQAAANLVQHNAADWARGNYMYLYPFQNGMVLFEYLITVLFGENQYILLQLLNIPFLALSIFAISRIFKLMFRSESIANWIYLLLPVWLPFSAYITFIYGTIPGFCLSMFAILFVYLYFDKRKFWYLAVGGVCMAAAIIFKSNYLIFMVALVIAILLDWIHTFDHKVLLGAVLMVLLYAGATMGVNAITERLSGVETPQGIPKMAWVAMGIGDDRMYGWWNGYNIYVYSKNDYDYKAAKEESNGKVLGRLELFAEKPRYAASFFKKKVDSIWNNPTFQSFHIQTTRESDIELSGFVQDVIQEEGTANRILMEVLNILQTLVLAGTLLYIVLYWKQSTTYQMIFAIIFIGGFLFQLAWEAKCQYTVYFFYLLIPYAVVGWNRAFGWTEEWIMKRKGKSEDVQEGI